MFGFELFGVKVEDALLMEIGLNAVGYLAAGGLSVLLYTSMTKRRWRKMFAEIIEERVERGVLRHATLPSNEADSSGYEASTSAQVSNLVETDPGNPAGFVSFDAPEQNQYNRERIVAAERSASMVESAVAMHRDSQSTSHGIARPGVYTRNRADVIRLAKEMLATGKTSDSVRSALPISESEMRLVEIGARR